MLESGCAAAAAGFAIGNVAAFDMDDPEAVVSPGGVGVRALHVWYGSVAVNVDACGTSFLKQLRHARAAACGPAAAANLLQRLMFLWACHVHVRGLQATWLTWQLLLVLLLVGSCVCLLLQFDINCGVRLIRTNLTLADVEPVKEQLAQVTLNTQIFQCMPTMIEQLPACPPSADDDVFKRQLAHAEPF